MARTRAVRAAAPLLAISANASWNLLNFRRGLIEALMASGYSLAALVPTGDGADELERMGVRVTAIPMSPRGVSPAADLRLLGLYYRRIRKLAPAAFLGFTAKPNIYGSIAAHWAGVPVIANITGLGTGFLSGRALELVLSSLYRMALRNARQTFFHNPDDRNLFVKRGLAHADRSAVIPGSGIALDHFRSQPPPANNAPVFLFIGRFLNDKGIVEFVEAARIVKQERPAVRFQVLGAFEAHPKAVSEQVVHEWKRQGLVEFLGGASDVRPFIAAADCVVLPSYREGLPRVLLEASAMGRAVIGTDVPGCREVVGDGDTGFLCEPRSTVSLAEVMTRFADLPAGRRRKMGEQARHKAELEFSETRVIEAYLAALESIASTHRKRVARSGF